MRTCFALPLILTAILSWLDASASWANEDIKPTAVTFEGPDHLQLSGYLFLPQRQQARPAPALVLMHGRAGAYSTLADGVYTAATLSKRHVFWGQFWASQGYVALLVDSFGPRGYPSGFPIHSYEDRPDEVSEVTVRPLDAYAALAYLRTRADVDPSNIALQGWSNGGSAVLATMEVSGLAASHLAPANGFKGALAFYPACKLQGRFAEGYRPYAPVEVLSGDHDEEVSAKRCKELVERSQAAGGDIDIVIYPDATHDFDDPGRKRQSIVANALALDDAVPRAQSFVRRLFNRPKR
jgi:carboxymethylenebutenolidase